MSRCFSITLVYMMFFLVIGDGTSFAAQGYVDTGDRTDGIAVISELRTEELAPGKHKFYFQAGWSSTGLDTLVPVLVLKGEAPGKRLFLTAAVHGDELNGVQVIHKLFRELDAQQIKGTLIGVPGLNQTGLQADNRHFVSAHGGGSWVDPNRLFPGAQSGGGVASLYIGRLWNNLIKNNADLAIDLHTQSRGASYPLFVFADFGNAVAQQMAYGLMPDMIKNDPGQQGTLETAYVNNGIPAVTFELGEAGRWQKDMISRAETGIKNVMRMQKMLEGDVVRPAARPFVGSSYTNIFAEEGGWAEMHVTLNQPVEEGDLVASMYDPHGGLVRKYYAEHAGRVLAVATDPRKEAGAMLVRILH